MWLRLLTLVAIAACARAQLTDDDAKQRIMDIFGEPADGAEPPAGNETHPVNGTDCVCVPFSRCIITNDSLLGAEDNRTSCPVVFDVCCPRELVRAARAPARAGCGWSPGARGAAGEAGFGEFPWVVAILHKAAGKTWSPREYVGGGSIIHPSVVLTAAHKVADQNLTQLKCRAGEWDASSESEELPHQDRDIAEIVKHEGYSRRIVANSVALIFLKTPFDLSHYWHVGTACVGRALPPPGTRCFATGWGKRTHGPGGQYARILKKVEVPLVSSEECESQLRGTKLGARFALHASLTCAGAAGADACTGDGGAPLVCRFGDTGHRYAVYGMAAWGVGCGALPGVYVNVPPARGWLADVMAAHGHDASSYQYNDTGRGGTSHDKGRLARLMVLTG